MPIEIPEVVIDRLPLYYRLLSRLEGEGRAVVSSQELGAELVILAGDIHRPPQAMEWAKALGRPVLYVAGNHEYYGSSIPATDQLLQTLGRDSLVSVLNCGERRIGGVRFLGATLWTDFRIAGDGPQREVAMNQAVAFSRDFSRIAVDDVQQRVFTPQHCAELFERHLRWLEKRLAEPFDGETVVVTHFAPSPGSIAARFAGSPVSARGASTGSPDQSPSVAAIAASTAGRSIAPTTISVAPCGWIAAL